MKLLGPYPLYTLILLTLTLHTGCESSKPENEAFESQIKQWEYANAQIADQCSEMRHMLRVKVGRAEGDEYAKNVLENSAKTYKMLENLSDYLARVTQALLGVDQMILYVDQEGLLNGFEIQDPGNREVVRKVFIASGKAKDLETMLRTTREEVAAELAKLEFIKAEHQQKIMNELSLYTWFDSEQDWGKAHFQGLSKVGALSMLAMMEHKVKSTQLYLFRLYFNQLSASALRIEHVELTSVPNETVLALGDTFTSHVFLSKLVRFDSCSILVDGKTIPSEYSVGIFTHVPEKRGAHSHQIEFRHLDKMTGRTDVETSELKYFVY